MLLVVVGAVAIARMATGNDAARLGPGAAQPLARGVGTPRTLQSNSLAALERLRPSSTSLSSGTFPDVVRIQE